MTDHFENGHRRIDRITSPDFVRDLGALDLGELRARRDECLLEREYLSLLRRLVQGRLDILRAEAERRLTGQDPGMLVELVAKAMAHDAPPGTGRGEALKLAVPPEEMALARRRVEGLVADATISDPRSLSDDELSETTDRLESEERSVSADRQAVLHVHDLLQEELKRRYKANPAEALAP
jgi:hypothetical protein